MGYIGRLTRQKGVARLLTAMEIAWRSNDRIRLLLAGRADPEIEDLVAGLGAEARSRVLFIGEFDDHQKASLFDAIDVFAMPSVAESFGIVYLEAWLCRRPVIGARSGAVASVIRDGVDGLLVDPDDPSNVAAAILSLLADEDRRRRFAEAGYQRALATYTVERIAAQIEEVYGRVVRGDTSNLPA